MKKIDISKEFLLEYYVKQEKSTHQIARELGINHTTILRLLKKYDIPARSTSRLGRRDVIPRVTKIQVHQGESFANGNLTAISKVEGKEEWNCLCFCSTEFIAKSGDLKKNRIKSCGCLRSANFEGYEGISGNLFGRYKRGAAVRNIPFKITPKDMWERFLKQNNKCAISGVIIVLPTDYHRLNYTASLDRIDSTKGYTLDNIQWVHKIINFMKGNLPELQFISWCRAVVNNYPNEVLFKGNS